MGNSNENATFDTFSGGLRVAFFYPENKIFVGTDVLRDQLFDNGVRTRHFYILLKINMLQITLVRRPHSRMRTTNRCLLYLIVYQHYPKTRCSWSAVLHGDIRWKYCRVGRGLPAHLSGGWKDFGGRTKLSAEDGEKLSIKERCQLEG